MISESLYLGAGVGLGPVDKNCTLLGRVRDGRFPLGSFDHDDDLAERGHFHLHLYTVSAAHIFCDP